MSAYKAFDLATRRSDPQASSCSNHEGGMGLWKEVLHLNLIR